MPLLARIISSCTGNHKEIGGLWNLGKFSLPLNCIGLVYLLFTSITFNFPTLNPVTSEDVSLSHVQPNTQTLRRSALLANSILQMNYTSAAVGVIMAIALVRCDNLSGLFERNTQG